MHKKTLLLGVFGLVCLVASVIALYFSQSTVAFGFWTIGLVCILAILLVIHAQQKRRFDRLERLICSEAREIRVIAKDIRNAEILHYNRLSKSIEHTDAEAKNVQSSLKTQINQSRKLVQLIQGQSNKNSNSVESSGLLSSLFWRVTRRLSNFFRERSIKKQRADRQRFALGEKFIQSDLDQESQKDGPEAPKLTDLARIPLEDNTKATRFLIDDSGIDASFSTMHDRVISSHPIETDTEEPLKPRVLFVSSNGAGLGHLTRLSAIDRWLDADSIIYTMSSAYHRLGKPAKDVIYFPSYGDLGMAGKPWNVLMEAHFDSVVRGFLPDIIVFDGTYVYKGVINVAKKLDIDLVWIQRGCWKPEVDAKSKQRHNADKFAQLVVIPGDYGCVEKVDVGAIEPSYVPPITSTLQSDLLSREAARTALNLPLDKKLFLVQLGAGVINDIAGLRDICVKAVQNLGSDWQPVLVRNPLSDHSDFSEVLSIQAYPLGLYYNAFDAGAFAGGYNTVQESVELGLPGVFVPNLVTKTDDQLRRVNGVVSSGVALIGTTIAEIEDAVQKLGDDQFREKIRESMFKVRQESGAKAAAKLLSNLVS